MAKKKRKAATPPHEDGRTNIRDSLPHKRWTYVGGPESDDDDPEDGETLMERDARRVATAPLPR